MTACLEDWFYKAIIRPNDYPEYEAESGCVVHHSRSWLDLVTSRGDRTWLLCSREGICLFATFCLWHNMGWWSLCFYRLHEHCLSWVEGRRRIRYHDTLAERVHTSSVAGDLVLHQGIGGMPQHHGQSTAGTSAQSTFFTPCRHAVTCSNIDAGGSKLSVLRWQSSENSIGQRLLPLLLPSSGRRDSCTAENSYRKSRTTLVKLTVAALILWCCC